MSFDFLFWVASWSVVAWLKKKSGRRLGQYKQRKIKAIGVTGATGESGRQVEAVKQREEGGRWEGEDLHKSP